MIEALGLRVGDLAVSGVLPFRPNEKDSQSSSEALLVVSNPTE